jgi:FkbM family methyltransferase
MLRTVFRKYVRPLLHVFGFDLVPFEKRPGPFRPKLFHDIESVLHSDELIIFDVGANNGQTVERFRAELPRSIIHSFEPGPKAFEQLKNIACLENVFIWNLALGSSSGHQIFFENDHSDMSSFLPLGERSWGKIEKETVVNMTTINQFCTEHQIERIDVLKSDAQGYDLEVFKGAETMMQAGKIGLIYFEVTFSNMYKGAPHFEEIFHYLNQQGFQLHRLYELCHYKQALWTDVLFIHERYLAK